GESAVAAGTLGALDLRRRPAQAGADLVGDDLDDGALLALGGVPAALLEPAGDDRPRPLGEAGGGVLSEIAPAHDVQQRRLLLPFTFLWVPPVDGETEAGAAAAAGGEPQLGITREVADQGDGVRGHGGSLRAALRRR